MGATSTSHIADCVCFRDLKDTPAEACLLYGLEKCLGRNPAAQVLDLGPLFFKRNLSSNDPVNFSQSSTHGR